MPPEVWQLSLWFYCCKSLISWGDSSDHHPHQGKRNDELLSTMPYEGRSDTFACNSSQGANNFLPARSKRPVLSKMATS